MYFPSAVNRADDRTRHAVPRGPDLPLPSWWDDLRNGDVTALDEWIEDVKKGVVQQPFDLECLKPSFAPVLISAEEKDGNFSAKMRLRTEDQLSSPAVHPSTGNQHIRTDGPISVPRNVWVFCGPFQ